MVKTGADNYVTVRGVIHNPESRPGRLSELRRLAVGGPLRELRLERRDVLARERVAGPRSPTLRSGEQEHAQRLRIGARRSATALVVNELSASVIIVCALVRYAY